MNSIPSILNSIAIIVLAISATVPNNKTEGPIQKDDASLPMRLWTDDDGDTWNLLLTGMELAPEGDSLLWYSETIDGEITVEVTGSEMSIFIQSSTLEKKCRCQLKTGRKCSKNDCDGAESCNTNPAKYCKYFLGREGTPH